jgi:hypothetical protein
VITCPRDGSQLDSIRSEYPSCLQCGYEDYSYTPPKRKRRGNALLGGLSSKLRYIGFSPQLEDLTLEVHVKRDNSAKMGILTVPTCPWDGRAMKVAPMGGKRRNRNERTYHCSKRHRINLLSSINGDWRGWM